MEATAVLIPNISQDRVRLAVTIRNTGPAAIEVEPRQLFKTEADLGSFLELTCEGKQVAYTGKMLKRSATALSSVIRLASGASISGEADVTSSFQFLPGTHTYRVQYEAYLSAEGRDAQLVEVKSQPVEFVVTRTSSHK